MENDDLEELKKQAGIDNSKLEELMEKEITLEVQNEILELLKDSQLFMPVTYSDNLFEGIEDAKEGDVFEPEGQVGFDINYLSDADGNKAVPLFTSSEIMQKAGVMSSAVVMYTSDLAGMLEQTDRYSAIAINPFTEYDINMPIEAFLNLFRDEQEEFMKSMIEILKIIKEHSVVLEENSTLVLRSDENIMIDNAVDGVFTVNAPFYVSSNPKFREDLKYTNILLMPEGKRILPIGPAENELDIIIAPGTEFNLEDTMDGTTNLWMCGAQPFYDE